MESVFCLIISRVYSMSWIGCPADQDSRCLFEHGRLSVRCRSQEGQSLLKRQICTAMFSLTVDRLRVDSEPLFGLLLVTSRLNAEVRMSSHFSHHIRFIRCSSMWNGIQLFQ